METAENLRAEAVEHAPTTCYPPSPAKTLSRGSWRPILCGDRTNVVTSCPRHNARSTICVPVCPVAPITKILISSLSILSSFIIYRSEIPPAEISRFMRVDFNVPLASSFGACSPSAISLMRMSWCCQKSSQLKPASLIPLFVRPRVSFCICLRVSMVLRLRLQIDELEIRVNSPSTQGASEMKAGWISRPTPPFGEGIHL